MGYLSQRKSRARFNIFLNLALILLGMAILLPFIEGSRSYLTFFLSSYRFQYYLISLAMIAICIYTKFGVHTFLFGFIFLFNYFSISSNSNLFFNTTLKNAQDVKISYFNYMGDIDSIAEFARGSNIDIIALNHIPNNAAADNLLSYYDYHNNYSSTMLSMHSLSNSGLISLSNDYRASYIIYKLGSGNVVIINLDLNDIPFADQDLVFQRLGDFVLRQYNPVAVIGDFGIAAYTPTFKEFLIRTELSVKNRVILKGWNSLTTPPTINVLGHGNIGVKDIASLSQGFNQPPAFLFTLQAY